MKRILDLLQFLERGVASVAFGLMTALVLLDVLLREGFHQSFPIGPKLAIDLMIVGGFLGAALTSGKGTHLKAEIAAKIWPVGMKPAVERLGELVTAAFCAVMGLLAFRYVSQSREMGEVGVVTRVPVWISQAPLVWTFLSMTFRHLVFGINPKLRPQPSLEDIK
jgi:TRAP-type C4-dicarboxylate transport system permease small subunit